MKNLSSGIALMILLSCSPQKKITEERLWNGPHSYPIEIAEAAQTALAAYPELKNTEIKFAFRSLFKNSFMLARPKRQAIFNSPKNRGYIVKMTRGLVLDGDTILVENLPKEVLLGWLGHELGHILDYKDRSIFNIIWFGVSYSLSDKYKSEAEHRADEIAIAHGFEDEILATKDFILNNASLPENYKRKIRRLYLSPEAVMEKVEGASEE